MCYNYRLIAFISYSSKILLLIINEYLKPNVSEETAPEQADFVKEENTSGQILIWRQITEKARYLN